MSSPPPHVSYTPPSDEMPYYDALFTTADAARSGEINGRDAVSFLSRSKLPVDVLKNIWSMVDQNPKTNSLDKHKFFAAVRVIQLYQNGQTQNLFTAGVSELNLAVVTDPNVVLRVPFFEGVTGVSVQPFQIQAPAGQQQQQQPPQQQQQQQPHTQNGVVSPSRRGSTVSAASPSSPPSNMTLTTQDPYAMNPTEKFRYEALFPNYEQGDGFVYGKAAVDLFTKSGLDKDLLRVIWNMVDQPVDNRLSKLEFAIAMHLIVCVSKKNLPMPGALPPSLQALKGHQEGTGAVGAVPPPGAAPGNISRPNSGAPVAPVPAAAPTGPPPEQYPSPPHLRANQIQQHANGVNGHGPGQIQPPAPPPSQPQTFGAGVGAMLSISDAFENMTSTERSTANSSDVTPTTAHHQQPDSERSAATAVQTQPAMDAGMNMSMTMNQPHLQPIQVPPPNNVPAAGVPNSPPQLQGSYSAGDGSVASVEELRNLQSVLQKLQAENVSLKAQLGQFSEEEMSVRNNITQTVGEISTLSMELTTLRTQVADAKSSLIEATSELKALIEKRDVLKGLLDETEAIKSALDLGNVKIKEVEEIAKRANIKSPSNDSASRDPPTPYDQNFFNYDKADSGSMNDFMVSNVSMDGPSAQEPPTQQMDVMLSNQPTPNRSSKPRQIPPIHPGAPTSMQPPMYHQQQTAPPDPPAEAFQRLEELKYHAEESDRQATNAEDHARALAIQYEDLRSQAEKAELLLNEMKPKKKGFLRGGKREAKKEIEQAKQYSTMKINEAQHAHQEMKKAEDYANNLRRQAQFHRKKSDDLEMQLSQLSNDQARQAAARQTGYGGVTSVGYPVGTPQQPKPSYGNDTRQPATGYSGYSGPPPTYPVDDASGLMGGSTGHGEGVMGSYASSVGFTDASGYGGSTHGSASVTGSTSQLQGGYTIDAASHSVPSEMLYPPMETPNNAGSISGGMSVGMSIAESVNHTGSVAHSAVSELLYPSNENLSLAGSVAHPSGSVNQIQGGYTSDAASRSVASEMVYPSNENKSHAGSVAQQSVAVSQVQGGYASDTGSLSVDFESIPPPPPESPNGVGNITASAIPTIAHTQVASNDTVETNNMSNKKIQQQEKTVSEPTEKMLPEIQNVASNDFGSFMSGGNNDMGFEGIPSPEKINQSNSKDSFDFSLLKARNEELAAGNLQSIASVSDEAAGTSTTSVEETKVDVNNNPMQNNYNVSSIADSSNGILIPSPERKERKAIQHPASEDATPGMESLGTDHLHETVELESANLTEEKPAPAVELSSAAPGDGLIPTPEKADVGQDNAVPTSNLGTTSLSTDSNNMPAMNNLGVMNGSQDGSIGLGSLNLTAVNQNKSVETMNFGIMSQSSEGGIPTPTTSKDEFDQGFW